MEAKVIIVEAKKSNKSSYMVWAVRISQEASPRAHCKSAYKAMRFAFLLKKQTGLNISENCLARLSQEVQNNKIEKAKVEWIKKQEEIQDDKIQAVAEEQRKEMEAEKPKKKRSSSRKAKVVSLS